MASKTTTPTEAPAEVTDVLDVFEDRLVTAVKVEGISTFRAVVSKVILGEVIGAMYDALDEDLDPVLDSAPASEKTARKDMIKHRIMTFIADKTGRYYSWSNLVAWRTAGEVNQTLPEAIRCTMIEDASGDANLATLDGVFGVWPLQHLAKVEDLDVRASLAERLAAEGITSQDAVEAEVKKELGLDPSPKEPIAAHLMTDALVKSFRKQEAALVGSVEHVMLTVDEDDGALLAKFGRILWSKTRADTAVKDLDQRKRKRVEVWSAAVEVLLFAGTAAEDDGPSEDEEPVL